MHKSVRNLVFAATALAFGAISLPGLADVHSNISSDTTTLQAKGIGNSLPRPEPNQQIAKGIIGSLPRPAGTLQAKGIIGSLPRPAGTLQAKGIIGSLPRPAGTLQAKGIIGSLPRPAGTLG
jgi:hypothetical protein